MRLSVRGKLLSIAFVSTAALVAISATGLLSAIEVGEQLDVVEVRHVPRVGLRPVLRGDLERMSRVLQDAVAAQDLRELERVDEVRQRFDENLAGGASALDSAGVAELRAAVDDYQEAAVTVSRRLIEGETGEDLVVAMEEMQERQARAESLVESVAAATPLELRSAFGKATDLQQQALRVQLWTGLACVLLVGLLAWWMSRTLLASLASLKDGLDRFGRGDLEARLDASAGDEIAAVAQQANRMAESLEEASRAREHNLWLTTGLNGVSDAIAGDRTVAEVAERAAAFLVRYLEAIAAVVYYHDGKAYAALGSSGVTLGADDGVPRSFAEGEGLLGRALAEKEPLLLDDLPPDFLRVRSALGETEARAVLFVPLAAAERARGVVELAFLEAPRQGAAELARSVQRPVAIAIEAALSRAATRELLEETQAQADRLQLQEEELRATNEELEAQQEELRQMNEELSQNTEALEQNRRAVEQKNRELETAQEALRQRASELATVSEYKSQFLTNMSHELRTPLNSMLLLSNLLSENQSGNLTDKQVGYCRTIHTAGNELLALINQVLDLARVESGKTEVRFEPVNLRDLADHVKSAFEPIARSKGLDLVVELEAALAPAIVTDRQRALQVVNNLMANAIKFTAKGTVAFRIRAPAADAVFRRTDLRAASAIALEVTDSGPGIALEDQDRVFAPFEQASASVAQKYGGTGLGLAISRELADLLGGEIALRSAPGAGSTFTCFLPLAPAATDERPPSQRPAPVSAPPPRSATSLLVIEDDPTFADVLADFIREQGLEPIVARTGEDGLRAVAASPPAGIVLDMMLPDIDGFAVLERLRSSATTASIPVHCISAASGLERALTLGAVGYVTKPASRDDLLRVVDSLVPRGRVRKLKVLVVEDDAGLGASIVTELAAHDFEARTVGNARDALAANEAEDFDCVIVDLGLADMDGLELLPALDRGSRSPAVIVYTGRALSKAETRRLEEYAEAVVLKEGSSIERLIDEIRLFAGKVAADVRARRAAPEPVAMDESLRGKRLLVADDDMRTVYALSAMLRAKGFEVEVAENGRVAIDVLSKHDDIALVLMDIMMPEMDGYAAMREIRAHPRFGAIPIVALTAKAMRGDEQKCLEAGASAYMPKPVDSARLFRLLRAHLLPA